MYLHLPNQNTHIHRVEQPRALTSLAAMPHRPPVAPHRLWPQCSATPDRQHVTSYTQDDLPTQGDAIVGGGLIEEVDPAAVSVLVKEKSRDVDYLAELIAIQQNGPKAIGFFGTRNMGFLHQQLIEILSYAMVLTGNHIYTSGATGTNAAVIRGALRAENAELLTVVLPQSLRKQPAESQDLLSQVENVVEMPQNDELPLLEASRICNRDIVNRVQQVICFAFHDSSLMLETCQDARVADGHGPLIVEWERGTKRQGALPPASPQHLPGGRGVQYRFDTGEPLRIPCTLHTDPGSAVSHHGFAKKVLCLALAVPRDPSNKKHSKHRTRLGSVVLNLAECAGGDAEHVLQLPLACTSSISSGVGQPYLEVTVIRKGGGYGRTSSDGTSSQHGSSHAGWNSRHSDTTASTLESNSSFARRMPVGMHHHHHHHRVTSGDSITLTSVRRPPTTPHKRQGPSSTPPLHTYYQHISAPPLGGASHGTTNGSGAPSPDVFTTAFDIEGLLVDDDLFELPPSVSQTHSRQPSVAGGDILSTGHSDATSDDTSVFVRGGRGRVGVGPPMLPVLEGAQSREEAQYVADAAAAAGGALRDGGDAALTTPRGIIHNLDPLRALPGGSARKLPIASYTTMHNTAGRPTHRRTSTAPDLSLGADDDANDAVVVGNADGGGGAAGGGAAGVTGGIVQHRDVLDGGNAGAGGGHTHGHRHEGHHGGRDTTLQGGVCNGSNNNNHSNSSTTTKKMHGGHNLSTHHDAHQAHDGTTTGEVHGQSNTPTIAAARGVHSNGQGVRLHGLQDAPPPPPLDSTTPAAPAAALVGGLLDTCASLEGSTGGFSEVDLRRDDGSGTPSRGVSRKQSTLPTLPAHKQPLEQLQQRASTQPPSPHDAKQLLEELRTAAAIEAAIHLARRRYRPTNNPSTTLLYAPARRIARTIMALGPSGGAPLSQRALHVLERHVQGCLIDCEVQSASYWWANVLQLRWMLWALGGEGGGEDTSVLKASLQPLRTLEQSIVAAMAEGLWVTTVLPAALEVDVEEVFHGKKQTPGALATCRWLHGLQAAANTLIPLHTSTSTAYRQLRTQLLWALLDRLDISLMTVLLRERRARTNSLASSLSLDPTRPLTTPHPPTSDALHLRVPHSLLLFRGKVLTFGEGVVLKMALTQWQAWAATQGGLDNTDTMFPRLRAAADLLMFPKDMLRDAATREEILPALTLPQVCALVTKFVPDDYAPDSVPRGLVYDLQAQIPPGTPLFPTLTWPYECTDESALLTCDLVQQVSLDMDEESDDDLDELEHLYAMPELGTEEGRVHRFTLLRELWASAR